MLTRKRIFIILSVIVPVSYICSSAGAVDAGSFDYGNDYPGFRLANKPEGIYTITSGMIDAASDSSCPSWLTAIDRDGTDGGHLTVELDSCTIYEYTVYTSPQYGGTGYVADLEPFDVFIEWDEDTGHGSLHYFSFSGGYVEETPSYVQVTGTGSTNWVVYKVTSSGTLTKTNDENNELDAIHLAVSPGIVLLQKFDDVNDCVRPSDEITYTIDYNYPAGPNMPDINDVNIIDYLPDKVSYVSSDPCGFYDLPTHTVTWIIGTLSPGNTNSITLKVRVRCPEPGSTIINICEIKSGDQLLGRAVENTQVVQAETCEIVNSSFEDDGYIADITVKEPNGWDVNIPDTGDFGGYVPFHEHNTHGNFNLCLYTNRYATLDVNDPCIATVSQEIYFSDANKITDQIIFDLALDTYFGRPWEPNVTAILLIDDEIVWDSNSAGIVALGNYNDITYDVNHIYIDDNPHKLSLGVMVNVETSIYLKNDWYETHWDYIECNACCGGFGFPLGDFSRNCCVNFIDFAMLANHWLEENPPWPYDLVENGIIDYNDLEVFVENWLKCGCVEPIGP